MSNPNNLPEATKGFLAKTRERLENKWVKTSVVIGVGMAALTGCAQETHADPVPSPSATELVPLDTYKPLIDQANCPTVEDAPDSAANYAPASTIECGDFSKLTPEQKQIVLQGEQLSVEDFRKLPYEQQQMFGNFIVSNWANQAKFESNNLLKADGYDNNSSQVPDFKNKFQPKNNEDWDIPGQLSTGIAVLNSLRYTDSDGHIHYDKDTASKVLSVIAVPNSPVWKALENQIDSVESSGMDLNLVDGKVIVFNGLESAVTNERDISISNIHNIHEETFQTGQTGNASKDSKIGTLGIGLSPVITVALSPSSNVDGGVTTNVLWGNTKFGK